MMLVSLRSVDSRESNYGSVFGKGSLEKIVHVVGARPQLVLIWLCEKG